MAVSAPSLAPATVTGSRKERRFGSLLYALKRIWNRPGTLGRIFRERLTEPLHLNVIALFVLLFEKFQARVAFGLVVRAQFAFSILYAAQQAAARDIGRISIAEIGIANGAGLLSMCAIA